MKKKLPLRVHRWWYRRMAWKNDLSLFFDMHPTWATWVYRKVDPIRWWMDDVFSAAKHREIETAMRRVGFVEPNGECRTRKWSSPEDVYALAKNYGWDGNDD